jgi:hypothetical protein
MKIQKAAVVLLLGLLLVTTLACSCSEQGSNPTPPSGWSTYSNTSYGISIQYPEEWITIETQNSSISCVCFGTGPRSDSTYVAGLLICVDDLGQPVILSEWVSESLSYWRESCVDFNLTDSSITTIADMPAQRFIYTYKDDQYSVKCMHIISVKSNVVYDIAFRTDAATYDIDVKTAQQMIDSLVIY